MTLKLYIVTDGPPSLAVMQALKYLDLECDLIKVNFGACEHMTQEFAEVILRYFHLKINNLF